MKENGSVVTVRGGKMTGNGARRGNAERERRVRQLVRVEREGERREWRGSERGERGRDST